MGEIDGAELLSAGQRGVAIDGLGDDGQRTVPAALLRECCHQLKDRIDPRGLRLSNVIVTGALDLTGLVVPFPLRFEGCQFDTAPVVEGAHLFELALTGSPRLPGLLGNGLRLRRDLDLSRSNITGAHWTSASTSKRAAVWLCESEIGGRLLCFDTVIDGQGDRALQATGSGSAVRSGCWAGSAPWARSGCSERASAARSTSPEPTSWPRRDRRSTSRTPPSRAACS